MRDVMRHGYDVAVGNDGGRSLAETGPCLTSRGRVSVLEAVVDGNTSAEEGTS